MMLIAFASPDTECLFLIALFATWFLLFMEGVDIDAFRTGWDLFCGVDHPQIKWVHTCVLNVAASHEERFQLPGLEVYLLANGCVLVNDRAYLPKAEFRVDGTIQVRKMAGKNSLLNVHNSLSNVTHYFVFLSKMGWYRLVPAERTSPLWLEKAIMAGCLLLVCSICAIVCTVAWYNMTGTHERGICFVLAEIVAVVAGAIGYCGRRRVLPPVPQELGSTL